MSLLLLLLTHSLLVLNLLLLLLHLLVMELLLLRIQLSASHIGHVGIMLLLSLLVLLLLMVLWGSRLGHGWWPLLMHGCCRSCSLLLLVHLHVLLQLLRAPSLLLGSQV